MDKKKSTYEILGHWLKLMAQQGINIGMHRISSDLPYYGLNTFGVQASGDTYSRKFREIKASKKWQNRFKIEIEEIEQDSRENYYSVKEIKDEILP